MLMRHSIKAVDQKPIVSFVFVFKKAPEPIDSDTFKLFIR